MRKAFTIAELLVVVIMLALLATIAVPQFVNSRQKILNNEAVAMLKLVYESERMHFAANKRYISCSDTLDCTKKLDIDRQTKYWNITVRVSASDPFNYTARASKNNGIRRWTIDQDGNEPSCFDDGFSTDFCFDD